MTKKIIDMTELCTLREIKTILLQLAKENNHVYTTLFLENYSYRQKLIDYVLSRIDRRYTVIELTEIPKEAKKILPQCSIVEHIKIRQLLQIGIAKIAKNLLEQKVLKNHSLIVKQ